MPRPPRPTPPDPARLARWFAAAARPLPWRASPRNPYHALVAEAMLQQTQVSRVIPFFNRFIDRFPSLTALAAAAEADVLALWSGLGYYRRARNLHAAARILVRDFNSELPPDPVALQSLPGIGRYTAGAIASIAFGRPAPIVDGNVMRVLLRVNARDLDPAAKTTSDWAWKASTELVSRAKDPAAFNEGLMELGATICLPPPAQPRCADCPWKSSCLAHLRGSASRIPRAKKLRQPASASANAIVVIHPKTRALLLEQRPDRGMWSRMWQVPTIESDSPNPDAPTEPPTLKSLARHVSTKSTPELLGSFSHKTTHRTIAFSVWRTESTAKEQHQQWVTPDRLADFALSNAQRRVLRIAGIHP